MSNYKKNILTIILVMLLIICLIEFAYAYYATTLAKNNETPVIEATHIANLTMTSVSPSLESSMIPGWVSYLGLDVAASGSGSSSYDLTLNISGGSHILNDIQIAICKKEDETSALAASDFTYTVGSLTYNTDVIPAKHYISGSNVLLPSSNCTNVVSDTTLNTLGSSYLISSGSGKSLGANKHDKYYIIYRYLNRNTAQVQGETFTVTPILTATAKSSIANAPKLVDNLIPVVYDEITNKWVKISSNDANWYNYDTQKWANAVTVVSSKRGTYNVGDTIEMADILGMWVWIPRYEYKFTNLGSNYAGGTSASAPGAISINFVRGINTNETTDYIIHPAFRNGSIIYTNNAYTTNSEYQMGGWDEELTGFWMGKFETSSLSNSTGTTSVVLNDPIVKPNVVARRYQSVSAQFNTISNLKTYHGISTLNSHMSKNSEWGAAQYLSHSKYGKYGNADYSGINKAVYINNSTSFYTGRSMGKPASAGGSTNAAGTYQYYEKISGTGASTTGNIYGIYDMVGGAWEYQMGWLSTASSNFGYANISGTDTNDAGFSAAPSNHKYYELYTGTTASTACDGSVCYGQGLSETAGWYGNYQYMVRINNPWFMRGMNSHSSTNTNGNLFSYTYYTGKGVYNNNQSYYGVRAVII